MLGFISATLCALRAPGCIPSTVACRASRRALSLYFQHPVTSKFHPRRRASRFFGSARTWNFKTPLTRLQPFRGMFAIAATQESLPTITIDVKGMKCAGCVSKVENALLSVEGVKEASVNLVMGTATVQSPQSVDPQSLINAVTKVGFSAAAVQANRHVQGSVLKESLSDVAEFQVNNMKCGGCVSKIETIVKAVSGVQAVSVNFATETMSVRFMPGHFDFESIERAVTNSGFPTLAINSGESDVVEDRRPMSKNSSESDNANFSNSAIQLASTAVLFLASSLPHLSHMVGLHLGALDSAPVQAVLAGIMCMGPGRETLVDGLKGFLRGSPNMNSLVTAGVVSALSGSLAALTFPSIFTWSPFFHEPLMLLAVVLIGQALEKNERLKATSSFKALLNLKPVTARLESGTMTLADRVTVGQIVRVLPGERIPLDGVIVTGHTSVDESFLTGESLPVPKLKGSSVIAGSTNQSGAISVRVTRLVGDTVVAEMVRLVRECQERKPQVQRLADVVASRFTYGVLFLAAATFVFWTAIGPQLFGHVYAASSSVSPMFVALKLAIDVMVIACPCALGLATPTAVLVGSTLGAEMGLLIRGGDVLEAAHKLNTVIFDKTGTLTFGRPSVEEVFPLNCLKDEVLSVAAAVEQGSTHPLAMAILDEVKRLEISFVEADNCQTEVGKGVYGTLNGLKVLVGTSDWLVSEGVTVPVEAQTLAERLNKEGKMVTYVARGASLMGLIAVKDKLRHDAKSTVNRLKTMGLRVVLLTGDRREVAWSVAAELGIPTGDVVYEVSPSEKAAAVLRLQQATNGNVVAMVGDGTNDAAALAQANIGIALRSGTDVAFQSAQIVLMRNELEAVPEAIQLSRMTFDKIRANLFWALGYNVTCIPIAAGILLPSFGLTLTPSVAGALMALSSISVLTNSLLLRPQFKKKRRRS